MQRKNNILMQRSGIAMIMAIVTLVILATIMAMSLAMTAQTSKRTTDLYLYEQAILLSQSASEYAMLEIAKVNPCTLTKIPEFEYNNIFVINVSMEYVAFKHTGAPGNDCFSNTVASGRYAETKYSDSDGTIIMDISVKTIDGISDEPISYFRRTVQKM